MAHMQNTDWRQLFHILLPSPHISIKKLLISLEKWQRLVPQVISSLFMLIHCFYTAHNTLCHCIQYCDPAWRDNPNWAIKTSCPNRELQLVALRVRSKRSYNLRVEYRLFSDAKIARAQCFLLSLCPPNSLTTQAPTISLYTRPMR